MNPQTTELPELLQFQGGRPVRAAADWPRRRQELLDQILAIEYGSIPPAPASVQSELLYSHTVDRYGGAENWQYRLSVGGDAGVQFVLDLLLPRGNGPFPVVINGDRCWPYIDDHIINEVLGRGLILAQFNRVEIVPDNGKSDRASAMHRLYPKLDFGALAAWAWGYHRCVDFLSKLDSVDPTRITVFGHSRGGKTALLAGATDERIALTAANCSGCGGAGCYRYQGQGSERLADIMGNYSYWFSPRLRQYIGRESELPFDQHALKALLAPRPLLTNEALDDLWANPTGTWKTYEAARQVYKFLGAEEKIGIFYRQGRHDFALNDWKVFLDFFDWQLRGKKPARGFDVNPFKS